jgi:hypothetical protein
VFPPPEPGRYAPRDALAMVGELARLERTVAAAKVLFARRVAQTDAWRGAGDGDAARWLARVTGCSLGAAVAQLKTAERLEELPELRDAFQSGALSQTQATHLADAAAADPSRERELVELAEVASVGEIVAETRRIKGSACDQEARRERAHRNRRLRKWVDTDGTYLLQLAHTPEVGADINAWIEPFIDALWRKADRNGEREPREAYAADALVEMLRIAASGEGTDLDVSKVRDAKVIVHVPYDVYVAGGPVDGRSCEIEGVGPVSVSAVDELLESHPFVAAVIEQGTRIETVTHFGRRPTALQMTALQARGTRCTRLGCSNTARLQADHRVQWQVTKHTRIDELDLLCVDDHRRKDVEGWRLEPGTGRRSLLPPGHSDLKPSADNHDPPAAQLALGA